MKFSELQIEEMKLFVDLKGGMLSHQGRLLDVLFLLKQIQNPEACDDNIPFCFEDYFVDGEHYLGKAIWVIQQAINTLDDDGLAITQAHFNEAKQQYMCCEDCCEQCGGPLDE